MMSAEPPFEQFNARGRAAGGWLRAEPSPRASLWLGIVLVLLSCLPVLVAAYPQMVDYPAHLARFHVMLERDHSPFLQRYYGFEWRWMGNLGADLLVQVLAPIFGLEAAGRIIAGFIPLLIGSGILAVEWVLRRRIGFAALLALSFIWSPALLLGFLNFGLALGAALFAFALWVRLEGKAWRAPLFIPIGLGVWLCHVSGWGILGVMVFGYEWHRHKGLKAFIAPWPLALPFVIMAMGGGQGELFSYGKAIVRYKAAIWRQAMRDSVMWLDYTSLTVIAAVLVGSLALRKIDWRMGWGALLAVGCSLALPRHIVGGDLVDARMVSAGLMLGCLSLGWRAPRWTLLLACALFLGRLAVTTESWHRNSQETASALTLLDKVPQGARMASIVITERWRWGYNPQEHIGGYAVVRKDALINSNFALPNIHMLTIREGGEFFRDPYHRLMHKAHAPIELKGYIPADGMDWFWYIGEERPDSLPNDGRIIATTPHSLLARLANPPGDS